MHPHLPPSWEFQKNCEHQHGWSDHYGALHLAAQYAGLELPGKFEFRGLWQHGAMGPWSQQVPSTMISNLLPSAGIPFFVARKDERECLQRHGYADVRAIGLPILYAPPLNWPRVPRSLLVVPTHTLVGANYPDRAAFTAYAEEIRRLASDFEHVVICVHPNCRKNGLWIDEFSSRGFTIVYGAQTNDRNALIRMRALFEQFEYVTSNGWGSHIPYALAFGAKVSVYGTEPMVRAENLVKDTMWAKNTEELRKIFSREVETERWKVIKRFHVHPSKSVLDVKKGEWFLGAINQLTPQEMCELLTERITPQPKPVDPVIAAMEKNFQRLASDLKSCVGLASQALRTQRFSESLGLFNHAVSLAEQNPTVHLGRGIALARLKDVPAAEAAFRLSLSLQPDSVEALRFLAQLCRSQRRNGEAAEFYERILALRPDDLEAVTGFGALAAAAPAISGLTQAACAI